MQIFLLDGDPIEAARKLYEICPKATQVVIREGQQLLSTSAAAHGLEPLIKLDGSRYSKNNHPHHPYAQWLREDINNWRYLFTIVLGLVWFKYGHDDIRYTRLTDYMDSVEPLLDVGVELSEVPFYPWKELADDPRLVGLSSFEAHRMYTEVKYPKGDKK